jgi:hypothetical protein
VKKFLHTIIISQTGRKRARKLAMENMHSDDEPTGKSGGQILISQAESTLMGENDGTS